MKKILPMLIGATLLTGCQDLDTLSNQERFLEEENTFVNLINPSEEIIIRVLNIKLEESKTLGQEPNGKELSQAYLDNDKYLELIQDWNPTGASKVIMKLNPDANEPVHFNHYNSRTYIKSIETMNEVKQETNFGNVDYGFYISFDYNNKEETILIDYKRSELMSMDRVDIDETTFIELPHVNTIGHSAKLTLNKDSNFVQRYKEDEYLIINFQVQDKVESAE